MLFRSAKCQTSGEVASKLVKGVSTVFIPLRISFVQVFTSKVVNFCNTAADHSKARIRVNLDVCGEEVARVLSGGASLKSSYRARFAEPALNKYV